MEYNEIIPFALATADVGYRSQILGAFRALADITKNRLNDDELFVLPEGCISVEDVKTTLCASQFASYKEFKKQIFALMDKYFAKHTFVPRVFITTFNATESKTPDKNADMLCHAMKAYYISRRLGRLITVILSSKYYKYRYVDLINIPKHLMTFAVRIRLIHNPNLYRKVLTTVGIIHNFNREKINRDFKLLQKTLAQLKNDEDIADFRQKFAGYQKKSKKVVFCLGGRVEGSEIIFDVNYAQKLYNDAEKLVRNGYGVVFVNGRRTPNNVADYLYEKTKNNPDIIFHNCKKVAQSDKDRDSQHWRIYSGRYEAEFAKQQKLGNIYPAVLAFDNIIVVHTMDSYAGCETASAGIPTAISGKGLYIDPVIRYDCLNLAQLLCPKFAIDFEDFMNIACNMKIEPKDIQLRILSNPLKVFAERVVKRLQQTEKHKNI